MVSFRPQVRGLNLHYLSYVMHIYLPLETGKGGVYLNKIEFASCLQVCIVPGLIEDDPVILGKMFNLIKIRCSEPAIKW